MECAEIENNKKVQNGDRNSKTNNSLGSFIHRRDEITQRVQKRIFKFSSFKQHERKKNAYNFVKIYSIVLLLFKYMMSLVDM